MHLLRFMLLILLWLLAFNSAHAEVMDKEPSFTQNIVWGLSSAMLCLLAARFRPWLLLVMVPLPAMYCLALLSEMRDPVVGLAMWQEAGAFYIYSSYGLGVLGLAGILAGLWWRWGAKPCGKPVEPKVS